MKAIAKKTKSKTCRIVRANAALAVIDIQERLLPMIFEGERVVRNTVRLIKGARVLGIPVLVTEQYKKGLGATTPAIAAEIEGLTQMEKIAFSACGAAGFEQALKKKKVSDVILCGIEGDSACLWSWMRCRRAPLTIISLPLSECGMPAAWLCQLKWCCSSCWKKPGRTSLSRYWRW